MVLGPPPPFLGALDGMRDPATTRTVVDQILGMWASGLDCPPLTDYLREMAGSPDEMWQRAAREIAGAFAREGSPVDAIGSLDDVPPTIHLYAQPDDDAVLAEQRAFAGANPWFSVERLPALSHFPMFEVPDVMARAILRATG
jgi:pimeloyl-ACP methyl ester carboxylesterase